MFDDRWIDEVLSATAKSLNTPELRLSPIGLRVCREGHVNSRAALEKVHGTTVTLS